MSSLVRGIRGPVAVPVDQKTLTVGESKTTAMLLHETVLVAFEARAAWYIRRFGEGRPKGYVCAAGKGPPNDPTHPVKTLRTAWTKVREKAKARWPVAP